MRIAMLAAGAAGMYCGSCMRDNAIASGLSHAGHQVAFIPLYTSVRSDEPVARTSPLFFGGINVFLREKVPLFHLVPRTLGRLLDSDAVLGLASRFGNMTSNADLGKLAVSVLLGDQGKQSREVNRLVNYVKTIDPHVIQLPNAFFAGMAAPMQYSVTGKTKPVIGCVLSGEDIFLDSLPEPYRTRALTLIREAVSHIDIFIATSEYYARHASELFAIPSSKIQVVWTGINAAEFAQVRHAEASIPTIGYLARICPEKGLDILIDAARLLQEQHGLTVRILAAGWLGGQDSAWFEKLTANLKDQTVLAAATGGAPVQTPFFEYLGEVNRPGKLDLLGSIDLLSVPTRYPEAKGIYVLEALAAGVPVVQPEHGSFTELINDTSGGLLVPPNDPSALAAGLAELLTDAERRRNLGVAGQVRVAARYTHEVMTAQVAEAYEALLPNH